MRSSILFIMWLCACLNQAQAQSQTAKYDQKTLLKNWTLSICLAQVAQDPATAHDAGVTASAYFEFSDQGLETFDELKKLVGKYKNLKYSGSVPSEFNTMKCIDFYQSKELDAMVKRMVGPSSRKR
jgi:Type VI secretion system (T6SS), amidase immunity protein